MKIIIALIVTLLAIPCVILGAPDAPDKKPGPAAKKPQPPKDVFASVKRGDRVTVILNNEASFSGEVKIILKNKIEIDVSYDESSLSGTIAFNRRDIREIIIMPPMDDSAKKEIKEQKEAATQKYQSELPPKKTSGEAAEAAATSKDDEALLLSLLDKFPPGQVWNKQRYDEIKNTAPYLQTEEEKEFLGQYESWVQAQTFREKSDRRALLRKFPPENGWSEEKFKDLTNRFTRTGVALSGEEQEFVNKYPDWIKARAEQEEELKKKAEEEAKEPETEPASGESEPPAPAEKK